MGKVHSIYGRLVGYTLHGENRRGIYIEYRSVSQRIWGKVATWKNSAQKTGYYQTGSQKMGH